MANSSQAPPSNHLPEDHRESSPQCPGSSAACSTVASGQLVRIKRKHVERLNANHEKIRSFFAVELDPVLDSGLLVKYRVVPVSNTHHGRSDESVSADPDKSQTASQAAQETLEDLAKRVQVSTPVGMCFYVEMR